MWIKKRQVKIALSVAVLVAVLAILVTGVLAEGLTKALWACSPSQVCPVVMHGRDGHESRLHVRCWDEDGSGEVTLQQIGGNDYFVRCE